MAADAGLPLEAGFAGVALDAGLEAGLRFASGFSSSDDSAYPFDYVC